MIALMVPPFVPMSPAAYSGSCGSDAPMWLQTTAFVILCWCAVALVVIAVGIARDIRAGRI